jgi:competence protein ComEC
MTGELSSHDRRRLDEIDRRKRASGFVIAPLVPVVAALSAGILVDRVADPLGTQAWLAIALCAGVVMLATARRRHINDAAVLIALVGVGGGWHHFRWSDVAADDLARRVGETPQPAWVRGIVRETLGARHQSPGYGFGRTDAERMVTRLVLDVTAVSDGTSWHGASGRALVVITGDRTSILAGTAVEAAGQLARLAGPLNPGEFDYRAYLRGQGIRLRLSVEEPGAIWPESTQRVPLFNRVLGQLREWSRSRLVEQLDRETAPLAAALLLGQRDEIDPEVNDAFARTGTTHLLAVSGLQLQALAAALLTVFRMLGLPRRPAYLAVAVVTIAYAFLVGLAPSVVRSTVMTTTICVAVIAERTNRPANTLALAGIGTLGVNPVYLFDVGCQLSFLAIAGLVWLFPPACALVRRTYETARAWFSAPGLSLDELERRFEPRWQAVLRWAGRWLAKSVVCSLVIWLAALPLVAMQFHLISPIGILLNIPLVPLTTIALLSSGVALGLSALWGPLGAPAASFTAWLLYRSKAIVLWGVAQPWGHRFVVGPQWGWVIAFYVLLGFAMIAAHNVIPLRAPRPRAGAIWCLIAAWFVPAWLVAGVRAHPTELNCDILAVGHGLAVVIETPSGQTAVYDCGKMGDPSVGRRIIAQALWARGINRIDTVFLSHADQDHFNGLPDLLDRFTVEKVCFPAGFGGAANPTAVELIEQVKARGVATLPLAAPASWSDGGVRYTVLHPRAGWEPEAPDNARSLVLDVTYHGRRLLLTGDLEQHGLTELVAKPSPMIPVDVMLSPHHGGKSSNPAWLYDWAWPRLVVVSQRHVPARSNDPLGWLEQVGIPVLRTWESGAVHLQWTNAAVKARGFLHDDHHPGKAQQSFDRRLPASTLEATGNRSAGMRSLVGIAGFGLGAALCLVLAVIEIGAWVLIVPPRSLTRKNADGTDRVALQIDCMGEAITAIAADGVQLAGRWFAAPANEATGGTVFLLHGFAEDSLSWGRARAALLNPRGWNVAALDSRGYGQSGGRYATFGALEAADIGAWLDAVGERLAPTAPSTSVKIVLWGRSMGAAIALRAAEHEPRISALVLESPMVDLDASLARVLAKRRLPLPNLLARLVTRRASKLAGVVIHRPRPTEVAAQVGCPALILHGSQDRIVPDEQVQRLALAFAGPPRRIEVPDADHHNVIGIGGDELLARITAFLDEAACLRSARRIESPL